MVPPAISPDERSLAVVSRKSGRSRLQVVSVEGVPGPVLSGTVEVLGAPTWSPDGDWIAIGGRDGDGPGLFKFDASGDERPPVRLVDGDALNPAWSPTEDLIVYNGAQLMAYRPILGVRPSDKTPVEFPGIGVLRLDVRMRFLPDGSGLVYMKGLNATQDFWLLDMKDRFAASQRLTRLEGLSSVNTMRTFDVDPTGEYIVFDQLQLNSDIVLIELEDEQD